MCARTVIATMFCCLTVTHALSNVDFACVSADNEYVCKRNYFIECFPGVAFEKCKHSFSFIHHARDLLLFSFNPVKIVIPQKFVLLVSSNAQYCCCARDVAIFKLLLKWIRTIAKVKALKK